MADEHNDDKLGQCAGEPHAVASSPIALPDTRSTTRAAAIFRALGDAARLKLLALLAQREMCVTELTDQLQDNLPAISQRLKLLRSERIVVARRQGKHMYYSLADHHIRELIANGMAHGAERDPDESDR